MTVWKCVFCLLPFECVISTDEPSGCRVEGVSSGCSIRNCLCHYHLNHDPGGLALHRQGHLMACFQCLCKVSSELLFLYGVVLNSFKRILCSCYYDHCILTATCVHFLCGLRATRREHWFMEIPSDGHQFLCLSDSRLSPLIFSLIWEVKVCFRLWCFVLCNIMFRWSLA